MKNILIYLSILLATSLTAQEQLTKYVISNGAVEASGENIQLVGSLGQTITGSSASVNTTLNAGFWQALILENVSIEEIDAETPVKLSVGNIYPNPGRATCFLPVDLPVSARVRISIHSLHGIILGEVYNGTLTPGSHSVRINTAGFPTGIYLIVLESQDTRTVRQLYVEE